jgi:TonB family protein
MKGPSLQKTAALSAILHLTVFVVAALIVRQSNHFNMPSPYVVSLVSQGSGSQRTSDSKVEKAAVESPRAMPAKKDAVSVERETKNSREHEKIDQSSIEDRIAEIAAIKRIRRLYKLREVVSIKGKEVGSGRQQKTGTAARQSGHQGGPPGGTPGEGSYADKISSEIGDKLVWPQAGEKNLETIISVKILKDGTVRVIRVEKRSGNSFFDNQAVRAIAKASPVTPPPFDFVNREIGLRFYPPGSYE